VANYWDEYGGVAQYLRWRALPERERHRVYVEPELLEDFRGYATRLAQRVNTLTGVRYADDPTIMAWEVMNEPRGDGLADGGEAMTRFLVGVAEELHRAAPHQLVLAGDEGFDARTDGYDAEYWRRTVSSPLLGPRQHQSFQLLARAPAIDAATLHFYPDWWGVHHGDEPEAGARWIREHARIAREAGKPLLFDEFGALDRISRGRGLLPEERVVAYEAWFAAARAEDNIAAVMPWGLSYDGRTSDTDGFEWGAPSSSADLLRPAITRWAEAFAVERDLAGCE
jgi:mannan endo-1,4-beta-mannosidase